MKIKLLISCLLLIGLTVNAQKLNKTYIAYIEKYDAVAVEQMKKHKIPASITLAQGLLESGAGKSRLARESNNHFGIKCGTKWKGPTVRHNDDLPNECFRAYYSPIQSYEDHSLFLKSNRRYAFLFDLDIKDYKGWAKGLKKAGYATNPAYATLLIQIIEDYRLYEYDNTSKKRNKKDKKKKDIIPHDVFIANGLLYVVAREGDTFKTIGKELGIKSKKLASYNNLPSDYPLMPGDIVYLKEKNKEYVGEKTFHIVKDGDSMHSISQTYGIRLDRLYKLNAKDKEFIPTVGERIWIK